MIKHFLFFEFLFALPHAKKLIPAFLTLAQTNLFLKVLNQLAFLRVLCPTAGTRLFVVLCDLHHFAIKRFHIPVRKSFLQIHAIVAIRLVEKMGVMVFLSQRVPAQIAEIESSLAFR